MTREEIKAKLRAELDNIYCYNCKWGSSDGSQCDYCHRKNMDWQPSESLLDWIIDIVEKKEE